MSGDAGLVETTQYSVRAGEEEYWYLELGDCCSMYKDLALWRGFEVSWNLGMGSGATDEGEWKWMSDAFAECACCVLEGICAWLWSWGNRTCGSTSCRAVDC